MAQVNSADSLGGRLLAALAFLTPLLGTGALTWLFWAMAWRTDRWSAAQFVMLFYGAMACAIVASSLRYWVKKRTPGAGDPVKLVREMLWMLVGALALWAWLPATGHVVGWLVRQSSLLRFAP